TFTPRSCRQNCPLFKGRRQSKFMLERPIELRFVLNGPAVFKIIEGNVIGVGALSQVIPAGSHVRYYPNAPEIVVRFPNSKEEVDFYKLQFFLPSTPMRDSLMPALTPVNMSPVAPRSPRAIIRSTPV